MVALVSESNIRVEVACPTVGLNCMVQLLKQVVNEVAGEKTPEA